MTQGINWIMWICNVSINQYMEGNILWNQRAKEDANWQECSENKWCWLERHHSSWKKQEAQDMISISKTMRIWWGWWDEEIRHKRTQCTRTLESAGQLMVWDKTERERDPNDSLGVPPGGRIEALLTESEELRGSYWVWDGHKLYLKG